MNSTYNRLVKSLLDAAMADENFAERWKKAYLEASDYEDAEKLFEAVREQYHDTP